MKINITTQYFLGYLLVFAVAGYFVMNLLTSELRPAMRQSMEDSMVDTANMLAELVAPELDKGKLDQSNFAAAVTSYLNRTMQAEIWGQTKTRASYRVYVTNARGFVIYDSAGIALGEDYSQWRDVFLTLRGKYGARTTRENPNDPLTSIMYVAAPIFKANQVVGVLTVSKPNISIQPFLEIGQRKLMWQFTLLLFAALFAALLISVLLTRSIGKLVAYAKSISHGDRVALPEIRESELSVLGQAMDSMRSELDGKAYVERYVHTLTHEMKSPLSTIKGAAELLRSPMNESERERFLNNIAVESDRLHQFIERLLALVALENLDHPENISEFDLYFLLQSLLDEYLPKTKTRNIEMTLDGESAVMLVGERFLVRQAVANLLDNALNFSPDHSLISLQLSIDKNYAILDIVDQGIGIPEYAINKVFDRFYGLPTPGDRKKGSGIGLNFVQEVAKLHAGSISLQNTPSGGVHARFVLFRNAHKKHINNT